MVICLPLAGWRRRAPAGKTSSQGGETTKGVIGVTLPPQWIIPEGSPYSRGPSLRLDSLAALILDGRWRWVRQAVQASSASYGESCRPIGTSNGAGSRADSSRGPWSSAELAPRPVRRGRSKPQKNALDSRKMRGMQTWIPGEGRGLSKAVKQAKASAKKGSMQVSLPVRSGPGARPVDVDRRTW